MIYAEGTAEVCAICLPAARLSHPDHAWDIA